MRGLWVVFAREIGDAFDSAVAFVYLIGALVLSCGLFMNEFFLTARLDMAPFFRALAPIAGLLLSALTMRSWAEDLKTRTIEIWMTLPLCIWQVVLGKFLAALSLWAVFLVGTTPIVIMLSSLGSPDLGLIASSYAGAFLLGGLFISVGLFASALSQDQVVAFVISLTLCTLLYASGHAKLVAILDGQMDGLGRGLQAHASALFHYQNFTAGLVSLASTIWFVGLTAVFLGLNGHLVSRLRA
jgi:ABC-2 type transport system permease protein